MKKDKLTPNQEDMICDLPYHDKKCEENLVNKVNKWWEDLDESEKLDVIEGIYPNEVGLIDSDELWYRTDWDIKLEAYKNKGEEK